jgi:hypothetical protein
MKLQKCVAVLAYFAVVISMASAAAIASTAASESQTWGKFWIAHRVDPPPPRDFMESKASPLKVLNLTNGLISDQTAQRWAEANRRRGRGDQWAACHLRLDLVNAGILGPPGLHGTDQGILAERAKGAVALSCEPRFTIEKVAVIAISKDMKRRHTDMDLTDFVIVNMFRANGVVAMRTLSDGRKEGLPARRKKGDVSWQLDTGEFRDDAVIGPLWYQAAGWSCGASNPGTLDDICGLVKPD